ncbi:succinate-semialdehyde dehydrogenase/glutarate-semialdehyde dehydrogenase [Silvibacterium bohemicum]|uniref:Succinate-semialdehyde dehydrogenase/glutarate-semialdehyde dehydrogenase n=1 Tax=Silvibacterium bohemicum TaxID=1577686 RepID=A0A841JVA1_9BACT|nr:NAD-dependent succinate-semialdehyde dehydrogenase [Silvibacterium bohemicum]MBB6145323.1 succinate-semialdehyde dehydrogenase/glutarate-semialdehyde dehydrogenase [Silvibacterium bohemicum]
MNYETINPTTGVRVASFPAHTASEVEKAIAEAHSTYHVWRLSTFGERAAILRKVADLMRQRIEPLAAMITLEMGKLIDHSRGETLLSADILTYYADNAERFLAPVQLKQASGGATVLSQPIGVIFGIEPWNFPYYQLARFAAPNLMAGNTVLVKHSPSVPQCADLFAQLFLDAGAAVGTYTNLRLTEEQASLVIADKRVQGVAVTGSERAGSAIAEQAGKMMKRSTLELGGSDPFIVLEDADIDQAVSTAVFSRMINIGQGCACAKRFIVVEAAYDQFLQGVRKALSSLVAGSPVDATTTIGPLSSERAQNLLLEQIERAVSAGATLIQGGVKIKRPGFYVEPGILAGIDRNNPAYMQEFFGPVFLLFKVRDEAEAIALANDTPFGLGSTIYTGNIDRAQRLALEIEAGMVSINELLWTAPDLPFGGVKGSGYGRELSELGIHEFVNKKLIRSAAKPVRYVAVG